MFPHHEGGDRLMIDPGFAGKHRPETGGIQRCSGAEHLVFRKARKLPDLSGDDIAGVGNVDEDSVETGPDGAGNNLPDNFRAGEKLRKAVSHPV